jgi:catalase
MVMDATPSNGKLPICVRNVDLRTNKFRVNKNGEFVYIKYHFIAEHGQKQFTADEATILSGEDPDYSKRDLWKAIEAGEQIKWTAHVQIMQPNEADATKLGFDPFDVTKIWPKNQFPVSLISQ